MVESQVYCRWNETLVPKTANKVLRLHIVDSEELEYSGEFHAVQLRSGIKLKK